MRNVNTKRAAKLLYRRNEESHRAAVRKDQAQEVRDFMRGTSRRRGKRRRKAEPLPRIEVAQKCYLHHKERANRINRRNADANAVLMDKLRGWLVKQGYGLAASLTTSEVRLRRNGQVEIRFGGRGWPGGPGCVTYVVWCDGRLGEFCLPDDITDRAAKHSLVHA